MKPASAIRRTEQQFHGWFMVGWGWWGVIQGCSKSVASTKNGLVFFGLKSGDDSIKLLGNLSTWVIHSFPGPCFSKKTVFPIGTNHGKLVLNVGGSG